MSPSSAAGCSRWAQTSKPARNSIQVRIVHFPVPCSVSCKVQRRRPANCVIFRSRLHKFPYSPAQLIHTDVDPYCRPVWANPLRDTPPNHALRPEVERELSVMVPVLLKICGRFTLLMCWKVQAE